MTDITNIKEIHNLQVPPQTRKTVCRRHQFLQGSWNYERAQNAGWCFAIIPAIKKLYSNKEDQSSALKRHLEFYNTQPALSSPIMGVVLAMEEERANGAPIDDATVNGVKVGMMGPLAGVGDPLFWYTIRPILGSLGASLTASGNVLGPLLFFVLWNVIRWVFMWKTQEAGYKLGNEITKDISGGLLGRINLGAGIMGMFVVGALVQRWVSIPFSVVISQTEQMPDAFIDWNSIPAGSEGIKEAITMYDSIGSTALDPIKVTTLQQNLDSLIPGLAAVILTLICMKLLRKNVSPLVIILGLFAIGILGTLVGIM